MHWLLLLAILSSSTSLKGGSPSQMNSLAANAIRQQIGGANAVNVQVTPGKNRLAGDFDSFVVNLDGFSADRLMNLANRTSSTSGNNGNSYPNYGNNYPQLGAKNFDLGDLGDIFGSDLGGVLGGVLGGKKGGRIGRLRLHATNFSYQGTRYDVLNADMGEIRFDWAKALRGDFDIKSIAPGNLALQLRGEQAARLIAPRLPSLRDVKVRFADGRAFVGARSDLYGIKVPFEVGARLTVQQNQVRADNFAASVASLRLPGFVLNELTRGVNPLYDFDPERRWPIAINLNTAAASGNTLAMRGGIQWVGFNRSREPQRDNRQPDYDRQPNDDYGDSQNRYPDDGGQDDGYYGDDNYKDRPRTNNSPVDILGDILGRGR
ncbi:MAG TPA: LmeA family phospholipid-binding protein [Abditibacteriaceae bacterium]|jgi:hypothetical protein